MCVGGHRKEHHGLFHQEEGIRAKFLMVSTLSWHTKKVVADHTRHERKKDLDNKESIREEQRVYSFSFVAFTRDEHSRLVPATAVVAAVALVLP